jgi:hypothetical protein
LIRSGLAAGILVAALFFQMLPFFLLMVVMAYAMGVTGGAMLVIIPVLLFAMIFAACGLVSKRKQRVPDWPPPRIRRTNAPSPGLWNFLGNPPGAWQARSAIPKRSSVCVQLIGHGCHAVGAPQFLLSAQPSEYVLRIAR